MFVRRQKQPPSGSGRKDSKTYYMTEHMQFILPYIKGVRSVDSPGNLPSPPNVVDDEFNETDEVENTEENISESTAESLNMTKASNEQVFTPKFKKKKTNTSDMVDQCFIDYITTKKQNNKKEEDHRKQFLLSMLPEINQMTDIQMRKFKRKMLDVIDDILGETSIEVANHFQPIQPVSNHSQSYSDYPRSVSSYCSDSSSILTSPMFIQNADNFEHTPTVQEYQSMHHGVLNLSNIDQVQQNNPNTCIPLDMQEYLTRK